MARNIPVEMPPREELYELYVNQGMTVGQLAHKYGRATGTISKWLNLQLVPTRGRAIIKVIDGVRHRQCYGPLHNQAWVPISKFHRDKHKSLGTHPRCTECEGTPQRIVFSATYKSWLKNIFNRLGYRESCRRLEISERTLSTWLGKDKNRRVPMTLKRENAARIVALLAELKLTGEVRHRKSIHRGATQRGEIEKVPKKRKDYYSTAGDGDNEYKRAQRLRDRQVA